MPYIPKTISFPGEMILLGTGTSVGVPAIGCGCAICESSNPKNNRTRSGAILGLPGGNLLIDTNPDLRTQLLREGIGVVHAVLFTHEHADHLHGMDDLRLFPFLIGGPVPVYASGLVLDRIQRVFDYAFTRNEPTHIGAVPKFELHQIDEQPFSIWGVEIIPIPLQHGPNCRVFGFRIGNVAYCTDTSFIEPSSMDRLRGLDVLILDALRFEPHPTHFSIDQAIEVVKELKPKQTYFTHMSHDIDYDTVMAQLPDNVRLGYDGLRVPLT